MASRFSWLYISTIGTSESSRWSVKMQISSHDFPESRGKRVARGGETCLAKSTDVKMSSRRID